MSDVTLHHLKTEHRVFCAVDDGDKHAEFRRDDRTPGFAIGHELDLLEVADGALTGRHLRVRVTHIVRGPDFGIPDGYALLSIARLSLATIVGRLRPQIDYLNSVAAEYDTCAHCIFWGPQTDALGAVRTRILHDLAELTPVGTLAGNLTHDTALSAFGRLLTRRYRCNDSCLPNNTTDDAFLRWEELAPYERRKT